MKRSGLIALLLLLAGCSAEKGLLTATVTSSIPPSGAGSYHESESLSHSLYRR